MNGNLLLRDNMMITQSHVFTGNVANKQYVAKESARSLVGILSLSPSRGESCK